MSFNAYISTYMVYNQDVMMCHDMLCGQWAGDVSFYAGSGCVVVCGQ